MHKIIIITSAVLLITSVLLFAYQEETPISLYFKCDFESVFGVGSWSTEVCKDYYHPYMTEGFIIALIGIVTLIIGTRETLRNKGGEKTEH